MKKILAMLLAVVMVIGMFAACTPAVTNPTTTTAKKDEPGTTTTAEIIPEELTLKILCSNELQGNLDFADREDWNVWPAFVKMCEDRNLTIEFECIEKDQYANQLAMVLAGDVEDMPDAVWLGAEAIMSTAQRVDAVQEGLFYSITDIAKYSDGTFTAWLEKYPAYAARTSWTDGELYWIGEYQEVTYYGETVDLGHGASKGMTVRLDWLDALGYTEIPNTIEEIEQFIVDCQEADLNGTGVKDEVFLQGLEHLWGCGINVYYGVPRTQYAFNLKTGKVDYAWYAEGAKEMVATIIDWLEKGLIPQDRIGKSSGTTAYRTANKVAVYNAYFCDNWSLGVTQVPEGADPAVLIGCIPDTTVHPNAYMPTDSAPTMDNRSFAFTKALSHPAAAAALLDIISSEEYKELIHWGTEGESFVVVNGNKQLINGAESYDKAAETGIMIGNAVFSFGILPCVGNIYDLLSDENLCSVDASGRMRKVFQEAMKWEVSYPDQPAAYYAIPTPEENEILATYEADLQTLEGEIFIDFLTGVRNLETDWEAAIAELEAAGLKEVLEVYQARADRFAALTGITG